jgi:hypothetical protein
MKILDDRGVPAGDRENMRDVFKWQALLTIMFGYMHSFLTLRPRCSGGTQAISADNSVRSDGRSIKLRIGGDLHGGALGHHDFFGMLSTLDYVMLATPSTIVKWNQLPVAGESAIAWVIKVEKNVVVLGFADGCVRTVFGALERCSRPFESGMENLEVFGSMWTGDGVAGSSVGLFPPRTP